MIKVIDQNGKEVDGLYRTSTNGLVVNNKEAYNKYLEEVKRIQKINNLESEVKEIKQTLSEILQILKKQ